MGKQINNVESAVVAGQSERRKELQQFAPGPLRRNIWSSAAKREKSTYLSRTYRKNSKLRLVSLTSSSTFTQTRKTSLVDWVWYRSWLAEQVANLPQDLRQLVNVDHGLNADDLLRPAFSAIEKCAGKEPFDDNLSIDDIVEHLVESGVILPGRPESHEHSTRQRQLVFAILGWQTLLYQPAFNTCAPSQLAICEPGDQPDSKLVFDTYRVPIDLADRPLWVLLKGFGNLLPARPPEITQLASESTRSAALWSAIYPHGFNAYMLQNLLRVRFRWVDSLALHFDYDKTIRTLSLFAFPSACVKALQERGAILGTFASSGIDRVDPRADVGAIESMLREVVISYRLLFGQQAKTRRLFRRVWAVAEGLPLRHADALLSELCACKHVDWGIYDRVMPEDRQVYFAARDFPVLYERVQLVAKELEAVKPMSVADLLHDRRDKLQWWTFWLVAIFGGVSILLSMIQVVKKVMCVCGPPQR